MPDSSSGAIVIDATHEIPAREVVLKASRSGGAGGQHVNTSSTRVELVWNVARSSALSDAERERVLAALASRLDADGNLRVVSSETRSQVQNRERAMGRLAELVRKALRPPRVRKRTRPSRAAIAARRDQKERQSRKKAERRAGWE